jgi:N-acetylglucosaminyl-diphospho-decaprenol L-rhamnosyltransferase
MDDTGLSVIVVTYNSAQEILPCLESLFSNLSSFTTLVIVVDSASTDATVSMVQSAFPQVRILPLSENGGFASANNAGLQQAMDTHVLLINPDTVVHPGAVAAMLRALGSSPDIGVVGPRLLNADGSLQRSCRELPGFLGDLIGMTELYRVPLVRRFLGRWLPSLGDHAVGRYVDWVSGACLLVRRETINDVGPMDEGYYMYSEELDWQYRMFRQGWRVWYEPSAEVIHLGGASTSRVGCERIVWQYRSMLRFYRVHHGRLRAALQRALIWLITVPKILALALAQVGARDRRESLRAFWRVLWL